MPVSRPLFLISIIFMAVSGCERSEQSPGAIPELSEPVAQDTGTISNVNSNPLRDAFFSETHMHTAYSLDAYIGGTRLTPSDAYRFARGESVTVDGKAHIRKRPLDFVAVTDHAEYIGEMYSTMIEGARLLIPSNRSLPPELCCLGEEESIPLGSARKHHSHNTENPANAGFLIAVSDTD